DFLGESNLLGAEVTGVDGDEVTLNGAAGALLKATLGAGHSVRLGEAVKLMIRPEMLRVLQGDASADNVLDARLSDVILVGGVTKTEAGLADGTLVAATDLTDGPLGNIEKNASIRLGWARESGVV